MTTYLLVFANSNLHRAAWQALLGSQPGISVAGAAGELAQIASFQLPSPAAILVDVPSVQAEWVREIRATLAHAGLLLLVDSYDLNETIDLLRAGATGLIVRDSSVGDLARGIIAASRGEIVLPQQLATKALVALARGEAGQEERSVSLTEREQEVLYLLAQGHTNKDIAQSLFLSVRTVEAHLRNIYGKLSVTSRTEAALWAVNRGYVLKDQAASLGDIT
jgi:DNA-binding NarL/FixJ family response regulator